MDERASAQWSPGRECFHCGDPIPYGTSRKLYCAKCKEPHNLAAAKAASVVHDMISRGKVPPPGKHLCVDCGAVAEHYDHRDYSKPKDIEPVCRSCNFDRGPAVISGFTRRKLPKGWRANLAASHKGKLTIPKVMRSCGFKQRNDLAAYLGLGSFLDLGYNDTLSRDSIARLAERVGDDFVAKLKDAEYKDAPFVRCGQ